MADVDELEASKLQALIGRFYPAAVMKKVLEAGCGSMTHMSLGRRHLTGVDISEQALRRNVSLDEAILGDIQTYRLPQSEYDVIICWDVLEHLTHPELALDNFREAARDGGLIVIKVPNLFSIKSLIAKFTPHSFHVWVYRRVFHTSDAEMEVNGPFPTYLRLSINPISLARFAKRNGLSVEHLSGYEGNKQIRLRHRSALLNIVFACAGTFVSWLTFKKVNINHTEYSIVLRKPLPDDRDESHGNICREPRR